jgi:CDP-glycerol glycerophosphotransferase
MKIRFSLKASEGISIPTIRNIYDFVWVMNRKGTKIPGNPKTVKKYSLKYFKEAAKSKYWLINTRQAALLSKRKDQIMVSTWHGTPLKKLGFDMGNLYLDDPQSKFNYKKDSSEWNYLISPNGFTTEKLRSSFAYDGEVLEYGYPRNDILYDYDDELIQKIKSGLDLPNDKKIILYAPTWRDDESYDIGKVKFSLKLDLDSMNESLADEYIVLIRTHYFISNNLDLSNFEGFVFDVSKYEDISELYLISDILITDYSSVFFDYANLKRPILFYTYDLDRYSNELRGFYLDIYNDVPGPLLYTTQEVINAINHIDEISEEYGKKYEEFYNTFCNIDDGNASKRIVERIWNKN